MHSADRKTLKTAAIWIGIFIVIVVMIFGAKKCAAQTAGEFTMSFTYSAAVDEQMTEQYGPDWIKIEKDRIREGWQNRKNQAKEAFAQRRAALFNFDDVSGLSAADKTKLRELYAKQRAYELEQKRLADSVAAAQTRGSLITPAEEMPARYAANVGKAYSPRTLFLQEIAAPGTTGGGGGAPPPLAHGYITGGEVAIVVAVLVVGAVAVIAAGYGVYHLVKWAVKR